MRGPVHLASVWGGGVWGLGPKNPVWGMVEGPPNLHKTSARLFAIVP